MKPEDAFMKITNALNGVSDAAVRTDMARKIFGKVGTSMIPMAKLGADGLKQLQAEAIKMGVVMGDEADKNAKAFQRAKNRFDAVWSGTKLSIGQAIMPGLASGMETIAKIAVKYQPALRAFAKDLGSGIKEATPEILKAVKAIGGIAGAAYQGIKAFSNLIGGFHNLVYIGAAWIGLKMAVSMISTGSAMITAGSHAIELASHVKNLSLVTKLQAAAQWALNVAMNANPVGLAIIGITALAAAGYLLYRNWDRIKQKTGEVYNSFINFSSKVPSAVAYGVGYMIGYIATLSRRVYVYAGETANAMRTKIGEGVTASIQFFTNLPANVSGALSAFSQEISSWASGVYDSVVSWFSKIPDAISGFIGKAGDFVKNLFSGAGGSFTAGMQAGGGDVSLPGHADGGIFSKEHIARFAEGGKKEAAIPLEGNRSRGLSLWAQAGQMLGVGKGGNSSRSGHGGSGIVYNDNRVFNINGGNQASVQAGIDQSNNSLMSKLQALQDEEARTSYA